MKNAAERAGREDITGHIELTARINEFNPQARGDVLGTLGVEICANDTRINPHQTFSETAAYGAQPLNNHRSRWPIRLPIQMTERGRNSGKDPLRGGLSQLPGPQGIGTGDEGRAIGHPSELLQSSPHIGSRVIATTHSLDHLTDVSIGALPVHSSVMGHDHLAAASRQPQQYTLVGHRPAEPQDVPEGLIFGAIAPTPNPPEGWATRGVMNRQKAA